MFAGIVDVDIGQTVDSQRCSGGVVDVLAVTCMMRKSQNSPDLHPTPY